MEKENIPAWSVAEPKPVNNVLHLSEERYRNIVEYQTEFVNRFLPGGVLTFVNAALARFCCLDVEDMVGTSFYQYLHEEDRDEVVRQIESISLTNPTVETEGRNILPDGTIRWTHWSQTGIFDEHGALLECQAVGRNITKRKQAEEALRQSREQLRLLIDSVKDYAIIMLDAEGFISSWNEGASRIKGWDEEEVLGRHFSLFYPEELAAAGQPELELELAALNGRFAEEGQRVRKDGSTFIADVILSAIRDDQGKLQGFSKITRDITERKRAERYREMARAVLQILNEPGNLEELIPHVLTTLKTLTGLDAVGIRLQDGDDFPYYAQEGFPKDFLSVENSLVERFADGGVCRDSEGNVCLECTCGLVISGKTDPANPLFTQGGSCWVNDSFPLLHLPSDIDPRRHPRNECIHQGYASVALVPIRDGGKIVGLIQFNDRRKNCFTLEEIERLEEIATYVGAVLMRKRIEEEKTALQQQYQQTQRLESLGVLAGGIAHDFNNLLAVIIGSCTLARMNSEKAAEYIPEVERAAERAAELCRQMLAYAGKTQFVQAQVNVTMLVNESIKTLKSTLPRHIEIKWNAWTSDMFIKGDASQLGQIVTNLLTNSLEAIGTAHGEIRVSLTQAAFKADQLVKDYQGKTILPGRYACLEVTDTGCGMDDEAVSRIFEPFYTTKFTGRGLGLSATLGIVTSHNGALQLFSKPGYGTAFKIYLPLQVMESSPEEPLKAVTAAWRGSGTILLAEDEEQVRLIAKIFLKSLGFTVIEASNGSEALELYRKNSETIAMVYTDMGMPVMNGYELFRELKKLDRNLPIIVSSGFGDDVVTSQIPREAVAGMINKPYRFDQFQEVLKRVFEELPQERA